MHKPDWRSQDAMSRRGDDIKISAFGVAVEASGRTVVFIIVAIVLAALSLAGFYLANEALSKHDERTAVDHQKLVTSVDRVVDTVEIMTCVLTLNDSERKAFRENGRYCYSYNTQLYRHQQQQQQSAEPQRR